MPRAEYDVAVIGAGPAGAVFAKELAEARPGLKILLIDGQGAGQSKVCGGLLAPDAQKVLARLGLTLPKDVLSDPQIFSVETIDLSAGLVQHYQRHYLNMDRATFDRWLLSLVPNNVDIAAARCTTVTADGDNYHLSVRMTNGVQRHYCTHTVVGADGGNSIVRRSLFDRPLGRYVAIQQWFKDEGAGSIPPYSCIFDPVTSDSCSWTIRKDGFLIFGGAFQSRGCQKAFDAQKSRLENFTGHTLGKALKTEACLLTSPRRWSDFLPGKSNVYLLGEAAGFISASSFEGISSAMLSGRMLAEAFSSGKTPSEILTRYRRKTLKLRLKLWLKTVKRWVLCSPPLRYMIMKSGIKSIKKY